MALADQHILGGLLDKYAPAGLTEGGSKNPDLASKSDGPALERELEV